MTKVGYVLINFIKRLSKYRATEKVYFTVHTGRQGFTDQLMQLSSFYKLGKACGFSFHYVPFVSNRSKPLTTEKSDQKYSENDDIYNFLGVNRFFLRGNEAEFDESDFVEINLSDAILEKEKIQSFGALKKYVSNTAHSLLKMSNESKFIVLRLDRAKPKYGKGKRQFFSLIHAANETNKFRIDFHQIYNEERKLNPVKTHYSPNKLKALIHIRQGDTAVLQTPWGTYIPVDGRRPDFLKESLSMESIRDCYHDRFVDSIFSPEDYAVFWHGLREHLEDLDFSLLTFSDGYKRAINLVLKNAARVGLSDDKCLQLSAQQDSYDSRAFNSFYELENSSVFIGEKRKFLHYLIDSALNADLIITAAQQRMLPKLIGNFLPGRYPVVVVLFRNSEPDYSDIIEDHERRFIYIDIDRPNFNLVLDALVDAKSSIE